jgi:hypothetical protein
MSSKTMTNQVRSYWVNDGRHDNLNLGRSVRFATRSEAERALAVMSDYLGSRAGDLRIEESADVPTTTFTAWNSDTIVG